MMLTLYATRSPMLLEGDNCTYENDTPFTLHIIDLGDAATCGTAAPFKVSVLLDGEKSVIESTIIVEYLDCIIWSVRLVLDAAAALVPVRRSLFDNYVHRRCRRRLRRARRETRRRCGDSLASEPDTAYLARAPDGERAGSQR